MKTKIVQLYSNTFLHQDFALDSEGNLYTWDYNSEKDRYDFIKVRTKFLEE